MSFTRHLLVDGANILNAWPEMLTLLKQNRTAARSRLVHRLAALHDMDQVRVTVVFDGKGTDIAIERPFGHLTFSVVYTPSGLTADDVIEQMVAKAADVNACTVATDDFAERETVRAAGAEALRSADLLAWVERAEARQAHMIDEIKADAKRHGGAR